MKLNPFQLNYATGCIELRCILQIFLGLLLLLPSTIISQITFSEVMFDVATNEYHDEYIEVFNLSYIDSIDISGWVFSDSSGMDFLLSTDRGKKIPPRSFAIILDGSYFSNSDTYKDVIPDTVTILSISDNSFGSNGLSNTVSESLSLYDSSGQLVTIFKYSTGNSPGFSDEKIDLDGTNDPLNWDDARIIGGTPGWKNSVSPLEIDPGFDDHSLLMPDIIFSEDVTEITVKIHNFGKLTPADSLELILYSDLNRNQLYDNQDLLIGLKTLSVKAQVVGFEWWGMTEGEHHIIASLFYLMDEDMGNNVVQKKIQVHNRDVQIYINEINFLTNDGKAEWIELINSGDEAIYLNGWSIADQSDTVRIDTAWYLQSHSYLVISSDTVTEKTDILNNNFLILSSFPVLNDQGDEIILLNPVGIKQENVSYDKQWLEGEYYRSPSLERINPLLNGNQAENWGPCIDPSGSTPGRKNSIYSDLNTRTNSLDVNPNPFSPDADGVDDVAIISGELSEKSARISVQIFDIKGRLIRAITDNKFTGSNFQLVWDGCDNQGRIARIGIYIIFVQVINDRTGVLREMKTTAVLAQKL